MIRGSAMAFVIVLCATASLSWAAERGNEAPAPAGLKPIATLDETSGRSVSFSQDGKWILTTDKTAAQVWDTKTWRPVGGRMEHGPGLHIAALVATGSRVLTVGGGIKEGMIVSGEAKVWDCRTGRLLLGPIHHGERPVSWAAISPYGTPIATCFEKDHRVLIWDVSYVANTLCF